MTRTRILPAGLAAVFSVVLVAGCGGGDDALSEKEFRAQANELCEEAESDTDSLGEGLDEDSSEAEVEKSIDGLVDRTEKLVDDLDELEEPESLSDDVEALLDEVSAALKQIDEASVEEIASMEDPFTKADEKAEALGLDACAN